MNGEDVVSAPRDHVIGLVRACAQRVSLVVCQPGPGGAGTAGRRSALLSRARKARLRARPGRVRFAESVCVNGSPLFPVSLTFSRLRFTSSKLLLFKVSFSKKNWSKVFLFDAIVQVVLVLYAFVQNYFVQDLPCQRFTLLF